MGARGPKPGCGDVSAWIVQALRAGDKAVFEVMMGCAFSKGSVKATLSRLTAAGTVVMVTKDSGGVQVPDKRHDGRRFCQVYRLNQEVEIASTAVYRAHPGRANAVRGIEDAFHGIVAGRVASG